MAYSTIVILTADSVQAGEEFNIYIAMLDNMDFTIYGQLLVDIDGVRHEGPYTTLTPPLPDLYMTEYGLMYVRSWVITTSMPDHGLLVKAESWVEQETFNIFWRRDATAAKTIAVALPPAQFRQLDVAYAKEAP